MDTNGLAQNVIAVASGKGGVGKSTVAVNLAVSLAAEGAEVGLLDADIHGPNIPIMMGIREQPRLDQDRKLVPLERHGVKLMSVGFMGGSSKPVIWRGPLVGRMIKQFLYNVDWGELDYLLIDLPPGTGDAQLTLTQSVALTGGIIVSTPQDVALQDALRGMDMFLKVEVPILGLVENMSYFLCPHCHERSDIFFPRRHASGRRNPSGALPRRSAVGHQDPSRRRCRCSDRGVGSGFQPCRLLPRHVPGTASQHRKEPRQAAHPCPSNRPELTVGRTNPAARRWTNAGPGRRRR